MSKTHPHDVEILYDEFCAEMGSCWHRFTHRMNVNRLITQDDLSWIKEQVQAICGRNQVKIKRVNCDNQTVYFSDHYTW